MSRRSIIVYKTDIQSAIKSLHSAVDRLGATDVKYDIVSSISGNASAWVAFTYKGQKYKFEYSQSRAAYLGISIPESKDVFIALINGITDLARIAERGIFDFGQVIQGFKAIEYIETPWWATFMGFDSRPRNYQECEDRYKVLVKGAMSPEKNPEDFRKLQEVRQIYRKYYGVA